MTCRERLAIEHPELVDSKYTGGCNACPDGFGYLDDPDWCDDSCTPREERCTRCWDREIPETGMGHPDPVGEPGAEGIPGESRILDSGDRTEFSSGAVRDMREGKGRCDLMPLEVVAKLLNEDLIKPDLVIGSIALFKNSEYQNTVHLYNALNYFSQMHYVNLADMFLEVAKHFEDGAKKYGENNWQKGIPVYCYIDSAARHYLKWRRGDKDEPHDRAFVWNLMCCIWEVDFRKKDETNA
jgi:hypothetical protein